MEYRSGVRSQSGASFPIMSFGLDPTWGGMMLALWPAGEDSGASVSPGGVAGVALPHVWPDAFAGSGSAASGGFAFPQGDWTLLQVCELSSVWAVTINTAKTTGWVVLLGFGSLFLYRVCRKVWPRIRAKLRSEISSKITASPSSKRSSPPPTGKYFVEEFDGDDEITGLYFGPVGMDSSTASLPLAGPVTPPTTRGTKKGRLPDDAHGGRRRSKRDFQTNMSIDGDADISEGSRSPDERLRGCLPSRGCSRRDWRTSTRRRHHQSRPASGTSSSSSLSPPYPPPGNRIYRYCEERVLSSSSSVASGPPPVDFALMRNASGDSLSSLTRRRRLFREMSVDSLGFPRGASFDSSCSEMSLDSALLAELDAAAAAAAAVVAGCGSGEGVDDVTVQTLERLQKEIDQLKNNCLLMDEDLEHVKVNRNLPGLSSLLEVKEPLALSRRHSQRRSSELSEVSSARACFAGLYSLTTIQNSPSFDLSDCQQPSSLESYTPATPPESLNFTQPSTTSEQPTSMASLEWDEDDISAYPETGDEVIDERPIMQMSSTSVASAGSLQRNLNPDQTEMVTSTRSLLDSDSMLSSLATYELDLESELGDEYAMQRRLSSTVDSMDIEADEDPASEVADIDQNARWREDLLQHRRAQQKRWQRQRQLEFQERRRKESISQNDVWMKEERTTLSRRNWRSGKLNRSSSSSGVSVSSMASSAASTAAPELPSPVSLPPGQCIIGPRVDLTQYAHGEWRGSTPKCATMLKGYEQIPVQLGLRHLRVIRGDNYCAVRAALFGLLSNGGNVAVSGAVAAERLSKRLTDPNSSWLKTWRFSRAVIGGIGNGSDLETEMHKCLLAIDNTVARLRNLSDRETTLAKMLNSDPKLDARLCEGVKLLMILAAIDLYSALKVSPESEPVFAQLLFARDTSTNPRDFMNNHLRPVGDTGGLEQVEMFLLGWSLGINLRVVRVSAVDSMDFVCWYPEENGFSEVEVLDNRKTVDLVAEDDRHYNILLR